MNELSVRVLGTPAPQGSKVAFVHRGRAVMKESSEALPAWRQAVIDAAENAILATGWSMLRDAVGVEILFLVHRGKSVTREFPIVPPDIDKYLRATLDALTIARVYGDDAQVTDLERVRERYAPAGVAPGARIRVFAVATEIAALEFEQEAAL